jgi:tetratricopeptide (TPR) repeat protein
MTEDALKCRFLEGIALMETDQLAESIVVFRDLCDQARKLGSEKLAATASYNLVQLYGMLGQPEEALLEANQTLPLLRRLDNRVGIGKLQWGLGGLLRSQRRYLAAIEAYRSAQEEFERIGMRADVAALQLVVADLLLEVGQDTVARREVLAALPVIDELKMVPEGVAALSLLRESLDSRINRQALRDLHGYFEELAQ